MKIILLSIFIMMTFGVQAQERCQIEGLIKDVRTQNNASSIPIKVYFNDALLFDFMSTKDGKFSSSNLIAGTYIFEFNGPNYKSLMDTVVVSPGEKRYLDIFLISINDTLTSPEQISTKPGFIRGVITDSTTTEVLIYAKVKVFSGQEAVNGTTSDLDGRYNISKLKPGSYKVSYEYIGYNSVVVEEVIVLPGKATLINVKLNNKKLPPPIIIDHSGCR